MCLVERSKTRKTLKSFKNFKGIRKTVNDAKTVSNHKNVSAAISPNIEKSFTDYTNTSEENNSPCFEHNININF